MTANGKESDGKSNYRSFSPDSFFSFFRSGAISRKNSRMRGIEYDNF